jgi:murein peptide amidase A
MNGSLFLSDSPLSLEALQTALAQVAQQSPAIKETVLGTIPHHGQHFPLPCYQFSGPKGGGDPIRIGFFAGIHGDEPAGAIALGNFLAELATQPDLAKGYELFFYPVCNPAGFAQGTRFSGSGKDLNREFWKNSPEREVLLLEKEIRSREFQGLISLHSDDTSNGMYGFVRGAVLARDLLEPALRAAERFLPRNTNPVIDGFPALDGIITECYQGVLTSPPELDPAPFEIILESPQHAPLRVQAQAFQVALEIVISEYQKFLAFAANL